MKPSPSEFARNRRRKKETQVQQHQQPRTPKITHDFLKHIRTTLQTFAASNDKVYTFDASLTNLERAEVHRLCRQMGLTSSSSGSKKGNNRRVSVYKIKERSEKTKVKFFTFSEGGKVVLRDFFSHYPPGDHGESEKIMDISIENTNNNIKKMKDIFYKPLMKKAEIEKKVEAFVARMESDIKLKQITEERSKLPIASFKDIITSTIESNQVVLISGETGCGKTTQVPQYLLDYMWSKGDACKIVCTQPRRISAISVAERISFERGESIGKNVGYKIRLESQGGRQSSIIFCTNGVLLKILVKSGNDGSGRAASTTMVKDAFHDITHIIVDEIHERDRFSDFMLAVIRDMLPLFPHLRVVLMSATLDAERYSQYFGGCPIIRVPGFTFDVKKLYLEDVLLLLKSGKVCQVDSTSTSSQLTEESRLALDEAINIAWSNDEMDSLLDLVLGGEGLDVLNFQHSITGVTPLMVFARKGRMFDMCTLLSFGADPHLQDKEGKTALAWAEQENQNEAAEILRKHAEATGVDPKEGQHLLDKYLQDVDSELVDVILIEQLLWKICRDHDEGAILVFLPGWDDINKLRDRLNKKEYSDPSKFLILALHSMIPSAEQKKVFIRPPRGCRKIILSTNIAETAVTIDDVVFVIDTGRIKEKSYDPLNKVSTLESSWISKASAKQREGRAGRCQPGICFHLFSKLRAGSLAEFQVPEIKRTPIEEICLQVKLLDPVCKIEDFLKKTLDPPVSESVHNAITVLQDIGALSPNEELTELGEKLGSIPVHPVTSKMLLFAISMDCLGPALTLACANDYRDCFTLPMLPSEKTKAIKAKCELASFYGGHGDQLAIIAAYDCWKKAKDRGQHRAFCSQYFVSDNVMSMLFKMRKQLHQELNRNGFIPENSSRLDANAHDLGVIHAVLVAGFYPRVGRLHGFNSMKKKQFTVETANYHKVRLSHQSVNTKLKFQGKDDCPLVVYDEVTRGDMGFIVKGCSVVGPLPLLLLAKEIAVAPCKDNTDSSSEDSDEEEGNKQESGMEYDDRIMSSPENRVKVVADRWLSFEATALDAAQIYCLRERLSAAVDFKITHPGKDLPELLAASIYAITHVLSYDGLTGIDPLSYMGETNENVKGSNTPFLVGNLQHNSQQLKHQNQSRPSDASRNKSNARKGDSLKRHRVNRS